MAGKKDVVSNFVWVVIYLCRFKSSKWTESWDLWIKPEDLILNHEIHNDLWFWCSLTLGLGCVIRRISPIWFGLNLGFLYYTDFNNHAQKIITVIIKISKNYQETTIFKIPWCHNKFQSKSLVSNSNNSLCMSVQRNSSQHYFYLKKTSSNDKPIKHVKLQTTSHTC